MENGSEERQLALWVKVLKEKYGRTNKGIEEMVPKQEASNTWRGIMKALPVIKKGIRKWVKKGIILDSGMINRSSQDL